MPKLHQNILIIIFVVAVAAALLGSAAFLLATSTSGSSDTAETEDLEYFSITNSVDIFDDSVMHEIEILMSNEEYADMIDSYKETGEKDYYKTDVVIDGELIEDVGLRLKGNLTLNTALGTTEFLDREDSAMPMDQQEGGANEFMGHGAGDTTIGNGQIPYLLRFDEFVEGQTYEGHSEIAIRTGDAAQMAEQIAYYAYELADISAPDTSYTTVTVNGATQLYSLAQNIDETYLIKHFDDDTGVLYKAGNFLDFTYLGDDEDLYEDSFDQKTAKDTDDLTPLIDFLQFVTESSDEEFEAQLGDWLDLDSFVAMMALDNLLGNNDSFVGHGSNFFLYYNKETEQFIMLSWDSNMAVGSGGGGGNRMNQFDGQQAAQNAGDGAPMQDGRFIPPQEMQQRQANVPKEQDRTNVLKERFFANETFNAMYEDVYAELEQELYGTRILLEKVDNLVNVFEQYNDEYAIVDIDTYQAAVEKIRQFITQQINQ